MELSRHFLKFCIMCVWKADAVISEKDNSRKKDRVQALFFGGAKPLFSCHLWPHTSLNLRPSNIYGGIPAIPRPRCITVSRHMYNKLRCHTQSGVYIILYNVPD